MDIYKYEIFGPVLSTVRAETYEEALGLAMDHEYGNGTAIFTRDGDTARDFANRVNVGMVGSMCRSLCLWPITPLGVGKNQSSAI